MKNAILIVFLLALLLCFAGLVFLYGIGEPVDGHQLSYTLTEEENQLSLAIPPVKNQTFRHWKQRQKGTQLFLTLRKTHPLPFCAPSTAPKTLQLDLDGLTEVYLGGRLVWRRMPET